MVASLLLRSVQSVRTVTQIARGGYLFRGSATRKLRRMASHQLVQATFPAQSDPLTEPVAVLRPGGAERILVLIELVE